MFKKTLAALDNLLHWVLASSANPEEASLTIKGILVGAVPAAMFLIGLAHVDIGSDQVNALVDSVAQFVESFLALVAAAITTYGIARKILISIFGLLKPRDESDGAAE